MKDVPGRGQLAKLWIVIEHQFSSDRSTVSGLQAMETSHGGKEAVADADSVFC